MTDKKKKMCRDFGDRPGCLGEANERFTMRFDDISEEPLYWCAHCGADAIAMSDALNNALNTRGFAFAKKLSAAMDEVEDKKILS